MNGPDYAKEIRRHMRDPRKLCEKLGLSKGALPQQRGLIVSCPVHGERTPSCSVTAGPDGTVRFRCFGCQATGDALTLIAAVHGLELRRDFKDVLLEAAEIAGLSDIVAELNGRQEYQPRALPELPPAEPERDYPPQAEVDSIWNNADPVDSDTETSGHLVGRCIDPVAVTQRALARVLVSQMTRALNLPAWARYGATSWQQSGHRMLVRMFDAGGQCRSVRAWRVEGDAQAKRLPPKGCRATGLVLANERAQRLLATPKPAPTRLIITEGEPDMMVWSTRRPDMPVFGIIVGSWGADFAAKVPLGSEVIVRTHNDEAGDGYAKQVIDSLKERAIVRRSEAA